MVVSQGEVWWADLAPPTESGPGFRRPVVVLQGNALNRSRITTVVCAAITSNLRWAEAPGNVQIDPADSGLPRSSVVNVSQIVTLDRSELADREGALTPALIRRVLSGIDVVLGR